MDLRWKIGNENIFSKLKIRREEKDGQEYHERKRGNQQLIEASIHPDCVLFLIHFEFALWI